MIDGRGRWWMGQAWAATAPPVRAMAFHFPHGVVLKNFTPATTGKGYAMTPILTPLAAFQNDFNVLSGVDQVALRMGVGGGDHARGIPCFATASVGNPAGSGGPSFDQVLASELGAATKFRSLVAHNQPAGTITEGATTAHMNNISWSAAGKFVPAERDPQAFFNTIVGAVPAGGPPTTTLGTPVPLSAQKKSVLDHVNAEMTSLSAKVGAADKARLDDYTTGLRELERQLMAPAFMTAGCVQPAPVGDTTDFVTRAKVFLRLFATAFKCDLTRYASFALACGFDTHVYPDVTTITKHHHDITHSGTYGPDGGVTETNLSTYYMSLLAFLLGELKAAPEGGGTVLDNSVIYFGSEMAEGCTRSRTCPSSSLVTRAVT
jgi:hypothetical protein